MLNYLNHGVKLDGILFDDLTLSSVDKILDPINQYAKADNQPFWEDFLELSNFAELFCLYDQPMVTAEIYEKGQFKKYREPYLANLNFGKELKNIFITSIDDLQTDRIFEKWTASCIHGGFNVQKKNLDAQVEGNDHLAFLKGGFYEELTGLSYVPSVKNLETYLKCSPMHGDIATYNLLIDAYSKLRATELNQLKLKQSLSAVQQLPIPAITRLIIAKIDHRSQFTEELLYWRHEFTGFRARVQALRAMAVADGPLKNIMSEAGKIKRDIDTLLKKYNAINKLTEVSKSGLEDTTELHMELTADPKTHALKGEDPLKFGVNGVALARFGLERLTSWIRLRRIQPLPKIARSLDEMKDFQSKFKSVWGIDLNELSTTINTDVKNPVDILYKQNAKTLRAVASKPVYFYTSTSTRTGEGDLSFVKFCDIDDLYREFIREYPFRKYIEEKKNNPGYSSLDYQLDLATVLFQEGFYSKAGLHFHRATEISPEDSEGYHGMARMFAELNMPNDAKGFIEKARQLKPDAINIMNDEVMILLRAGDMKAAEPLLDKILSIDNNDQTALLNLAGIFLNTGRIDQAIKIYKRVLAEIAPKSMHAAITHSLAQCYIASADYVNAKNEVEWLLEENPYDTDAYQLLLKIYGRQDAHQAISDLIDIIGQKAVERIEAKDYRPAYKLLKLMVELRQINPGYLYSLGVRLDAENELDLAIIFYSLSLKADPSLTRSMANLAIDLCLTENYKKSIEYALKARELDPLDAINLNCLVMNYMVIGEFDEAKKYIMEIIALFEANHNVPSVLLDNAISNLKEIEDGKVKNIVVRQAASPESRS